MLVANTSHLTRLTLKVVGLDGIPPFNQVSTDKTLEMLLSLLLYSI